MTKTIPDPTPTQADLLHRTLAEFVANAYCLASGTQADCIEALRRLGELLPAGRMTAGDFRRRAAACACYLAAARRVVELLESA